jgi:hypothetical protein
MTLKKMILLPLAIALLIPTVSNATVGRYMALGGEGTQYIVMDASNPGIFPQLTPNWKKLFGSEFSGGGSSWSQFLVYAVWDFGDEKSAIKIVLDSTPSSLFDVGPSGAGVFRTGDPAGVLSGNYHQLNVTYGRPMGDDMDIGVGIRMEGKSYKTDTGAETDASYSSIGLSLGVTALEKKLDAALLFDMPSFTRDGMVSGSNTTMVENDGSSRFGLVARYWHVVNEMYTLVPHFRFMTHKTGATGKDLPNPDGIPGFTAASLTTTNFVLGVGNNWRPEENTLIIFEIAVESHSDKYEASTDNASGEEKDSEFNIIWRAGGETRILSWLWGRCGAVRNWEGMKMTTDDGTTSTETTYGVTRTDIYVGASTHFKRLHMDFVVMPDFFKYGPSFLGGDNGRAGGIASYLSLKFELDEANWLP